MIIVIQDAAGRHPDAGHMKTRDGQRVLFVADPQQAPAAAGVHYAQPDAFSNFGATWRKLLLSYNANPRNNPLGLLPAWKLYPDDIYRRLVEQLAPAKTFILSAGWGLIKASFLTPNYDITCSPAAEPFRRRDPADHYTDFCMLPESGDEDLYFFGGAEYVPLFCQLTAAYAGRRTVFYHAAQPPEAPGCVLQRFDTDHPANWHHECVTAFLATRPEPGSEQAAPRVSNLANRLRAAMEKAAGAPASLAGSAAEPDVATVRAAVHSARDRLAEYRWLMQSLHAVDVSQDTEFQERCNAFHGITQRSKEWHSAYYRLLETAKVIGAEFADILDEMWVEAGRYEPDYASGLVAMVDPAKPVWDHFALLHSGLRAPAYPDPDKLEKAAEVYRRLREWYAERLESPGGRRLLALFDEAAPGYEDIDALKKLEFILQHTSREHHVVTAAG